MAVFSNNYIPNQGMKNTSNPHAIFTQGNPQQTPVQQAIASQMSVSTGATMNSQQQMQSQMNPQVNPFTQEPFGQPFGAYQTYSFDQTSGGCIDPYQGTLQSTGMEPTPYQPTPYQYAANVIFKFHVANLTAVEAVDTFISQVRDKLVSKGRAANWFVKINKNSGYTVTCSNGKGVARGDYWTMDITNISVTDLLEVYPILKEFANANDLQLNVVESLFGHQVTVNMISSDVQSMISTFTQKVDAEHQSQEPAKGPLDGMTLKNVKTVTRPIKGTDMVEITKTEYEVEMSRNTPSVEEVKQALKP